MTISLLDQSKHYPENIIDIPKCSNQKPLYFKLPLQIPP